MSLKRKLQRLKETSQEGRSPSERVAYLRELMRERAPRSGTHKKSTRARANRVAQPKPGEGHEEVLPGKTVQTPHGVIRRVGSTRRAKSRHGDVSLELARTLCHRAVERMALFELGRRHTQRVLYFDTETTGLAGGTGTLPFVVGFGAFDRDRFEVEQLILTSPGAEKPILKRVAERLEDATLWVTYNGKSFDWPLLRNRFAMNRISIPEEKPHVDLLHCARRVYKRRLQRMRLVML